MDRKRICANCVHWAPGEYWGTGSGKHGVLVECKGTCDAKKPNIRKRWNYHPACERDYEKKKMTGFIYHGGDKPIEEDVTNITELMKELRDDNNF